MKIRYFTQCNAVQLGFLRERLVDLSKFNVNEELTFINESSQEIKFSGTIKKLLQSDCFIIMSMKCNDPQSIANKADMPLV